MKKRRGDCEARAKGKWACGSKLTAMGMTVEQRKHPDDAGGSGNRQPQRKRHRQTERENRDKDHGFDKRKAYTGDGRHKPDHHHPNEGQGESPDRTPAKSRGPQTDGNHCKDVIETENRMGQTGGE